MRSFLKQYRIDLFLAALCCVALGIVLVVWPAETLNIICKALAVILIVIGFAEGLKCHKGSNNAITMILSSVAVFIGVYIFINPRMMAELVPIVIGVILLLHGVQDVQMAIMIKKSGYLRWWIALILAVLSMILGVVCIGHAFRLVTLTFQIIGILLIYDGLSDFWIAIKVIWAVRQQEKIDEALESEYKEVE